MGVSHDREMVKKYFQREMLLNAFAKKYFQLHFQRNIFNCILECFQMHFRRNNYFSSLNLCDQQSLVFYPQSEGAR